MSKHKSFESKHSVDLRKSKLLNPPKKPRRPKFVDWNTYNKNWIFLFFILATVFVFVLGSYHVAIVKPQLDNKQDWDDEYCWQDNQGLWTCNYYNEGSIDEVEESIQDRNKFREEPTQQQEEEKYYNCWYYRPPTKECPNDHQSQKFLRKELIECEALKFQADNNALGCNATDILEWHQEEYRDG